MLSLYKYEYTRNKLILEEINKELEEIGQNKI